MQKKTIYLHVGTHKTGTSYLQALMRANEAKLSRERIRYYGACTRDCGGEINEELFAHARRFKDDKAHHTLIISDEDLSHNREDVVPNLINRLSSDFDIKVFCYVREIVSYYISFYAFASVWLSSRSIGPDFSGLVEYLDRQTAYISNHDLLLKLVEMLGKHSVIVRPYAKKNFRDGKIENDFFDVIGCNISTFNSPEKANVSPNLKQAEKIYYALRLTSNATVRSKAKDKILRHDLSGQVSWTITRAELDRIYATYRRYETSLVQTFFGHAETEKLFGLGYGDWVTKIGNAKGDRFLTVNERQEIRELVAIVQNELILESHLTHNRPVKSRLQKLLDLFDHQ